MPPLLSEDKNMYSIFYEFTDDAIVEVDTLVEALAILKYLATVTEFTHELADYNGTSVFATGDYDLDHRLAIIENNKVKVF